MQIDPHLWDALQAHGVTEAHLDLLLRLLQLQKNGSWSWHIVHGQVQQCDLRLVTSARPYDVARVSDVLLGGESVLW